MLRSLGWRKKASSVCSGASPRTSARSRPRALGMPGLPSLPGSPTSPATPPRFGSRTCSPGSRARSSSEPSPAALRRSPPAACARSQRASITHLPPAPARSSAFLASSKTSTTTPAPRLRVVVRPIRARHLPVRSPRPGIQARRLRRVLRQIRSCLRVSLQPGASSGSSARRVGLRWTPPTRPCSTSIIPIATHKIGLGPRRDSCRYASPTIY